MLGQRVPIFDHGMVLTKEMLVGLSEYSIGTNELLYQGFSKGILRGCRLTVDVNHLTVGQGLLFFEHRILMITESVTMEYTPNNQCMALKFLIGEEMNHNNVLERTVELVITPELSDSQQSIELARFRLQSGAILRNQYKNFMDYNTEYDTLNIIHSNWSSYDGDTLSPILLRGFADEMMQLREKNPLDMMFCQQIYGMNGSSLSLSAILNYIRCRLPEQKKIQSKIEIYQGLLQILRMGSGSRLEKTTSNQRERKSIFVDY
jgi:hypothetical protein